MDVVNKALLGMEKVTSFASSIQPIFGIVSSLIRVVRISMKPEKDHPQEKNFQAIHTKLESISEKTHELEKELAICEVNQTYSKYEKQIKHQYAAFNNMLAQVKKDPDNRQRYMETFEKIYKEDGQDNNLDVYYRGVMGTGTLFATPILEAYLEKYKSDRTTMDDLCSYITQLFHKGLIAYVGFMGVTGFDDDEINVKQNEWEKMMNEIQEKMEKILSRCQSQSS